MEYLLAVLMGIVQGLTEFIPVSSTAHLRLLPELFNRQDMGAAYTAVIQIGTLFSLLIYFKKDIFLLVTDFFISLKRRDYNNPNFLLSLYIMIGTLPIVIAGVLLKNYIENELRSLSVIASSLIFFAILLLISEKTGKKEKDLTRITTKDAFIIGIAQALALIPGASRSGVTICMALFLGYKRDVSARFSFLLSIPSLLGAGIFEIKEIFRSSFETSISSVIIATIISFIAGIIAIEFLLRFLINHKVNIFAYYRIILGLIILFLLFRQI